MPVLQASGIGSGLDVTGLVSQLVAAEREPTENRLNRWETRVDNLLSAFGRLSSSLDKLQTSLADIKTATNFQSRTATVADETVLTATAANTAALGTYSLTVNNVAEAHKLRSSFGVADINATWASPLDDATSVGTGTLSIQVGTSAAVNLNITTGSMSEIRDAINTNVTGVTAVIINDGTNNYLSIAADDTGTANALTISVTGDGDGVDGDNNGLSRLINANMTQTTAAADASFTVDGVAVTSSSNTVTTAIPDVTLNLVAAGTTSLNVGADSTATKDKIEAFVETYNNTIKTINDLTKYDQDSDTAGALLSDSLAYGLKTDLQRILGGGSTNTGIFESLTQLGYATSEDDGTLYLKNSADLDAALASNYDDVGLMIADYATRLDNLIDPYLGVTGYLQGREDGLQDQLNQIEDERARLDYRMELIQERYTKQFSALDALISNMNNTMSFLSSQLASLPGPAPIN